VVHHRSPHGEAAQGAHVLRTLDPRRALGATLTFALTLGACGTTHSATRGAEDSMTQRRKQQVVALLNSIQTGDAAAIAVINPDKYLQHNLAAADGLAGFGALLAQLPPGSAKVDVVRVFADGDYVFTHTAYDFFGPKIGFDIFRFEGDRIVEHWDNLQQTPAGPNPSGRSMIDGAREPTDLGATEANKARVRAFVEDGHGEKLPVPQQPRVSAAQPADRRRYRGPHGRARGHGRQPCP
jgi:predicted SnoaL-like aldol condensation-catalyzing enzyme